MHLKKGNFIDYLGLILIFLMFFSCTFALLYNSKISQERSSVIDFVNKESVTLQGTLSGYSVNSTYLDMYENGTKIDITRANEIKADAINNFTNNIKSFFDNHSGTLKLDNANPVIVNIIDNGDKTSVAIIDINVNYIATFRSPYTTSSDTGKTSSNNRFGMSFHEHITRVIENPKRYKN